MKNNKTPRPIVVKKGQMWEDNDTRSMRRVIVDRISRINGTACVHTMHTGKKSEIQLARFRSRFTLLDSMSVADAA